MNVDKKQLAVWAGMIGPVLFAATFTIEGWLRPGYNPNSMFVSELSLGPRGWIQILNFIVFGVLFLWRNENNFAQFARYFLHDARIDYASSFSFLHKYNHDENAGTL